MVFRSLGLDVALAIGHAVRVSLRLPHLMADRYGLNKRRRSRKRQRQEGVSDCRSDWSKYQIPFSHCVAGVAPNPTWRLASVSRWRTEINEPQHPPSWPSPAGAGPLRTRRGRVRRAVLRARGSARGPIQRFPRSRLPGVETRTGPTRTEESSPRLRRRSTAWPGLAHWELPRADAPRVPNRTDPRCAPDADRRSHLPTLRSGAPAETPQSATNGGGLNRSAHHPGRLERSARCVIDSFA